MAQSVYENSQDDDTRRFVPDEVYDSVEEARKAIDFLISRYDRNDGPFVYPIITHDGGKNLASIRVLEKLKTDIVWNFLNLTFISICNILHICR